MPDYKINISVDDQDSGRKIDNIDRKLKEVTKPHKIRIEFPDVSKARQNLQEVSKYSGLAVQAFKQFTPIGRQFSELEDSVKVVGSGLMNVGRSLAGMSSYASPIRGMADSFGLVSQAIDGAVRTTASLGFAIFGVTQSVNLLKAAFGSAFEDTVGREVKLREQVLQTATTLAGTNRVFAAGFEIKDPVQKLKVLEGSVSKSIERIRDKSLEIAGTTSEAMIDVFRIVASQLGNFGGTMKQAEDLAAKFSGALGTLGMSNPMYAQQEIGSIMMGYIDMNSRLAKTIGITNADVERAKQQGKLYEFLSEKLAIFEAGQKKAALGFAGITSNIQELEQELKRSFGASLLDPILKRIGAFYDKLSGKETLKTLKQTATAFGQMVGSTLNTALGTVARAPVFQGIDSKGITNAAKQLQSIFAKVTIYIQEQFARMAPSIQGIVDRIVKSVAVLAKAFAEVGAAMIRLKIDQIAVQLQAFAALSNVVLGVAKAYSYYLKTIQDIISTPLGRYINELSATFKVLDRLGVNGLAQFIMALLSIKKIVPEIVASVKNIASSVVSVISSILARISTVITGVTEVVAKAVSTTVTTVTVGIMRILALISEVAARIAITLNVISTRMMLSGGLLEKLAAPIYAVSKAFDQIAAGAKKAEVEVANLGARGLVAMRNLQTGAEGAASKVNGLGGALREGVASGAKTAGAAVLGFGLNILKGVASMALWTIAITVVVDGLRRLGEWWDEYSQNQEYKQTVDGLNNGLLDQAEAAKKAGRAIDEVTAARLRMAKAALTKEKDTATKQLEDAVKAYDNFQRYAQDKRKGRLSAPGLEVQFGVMRFLNPDATPSINNARLLAGVVEAKRRLAEVQKAIDDFEKKNNPSPEADPQLKQQENRQQIEELARFEKETRRSIEDEVYNYRRQAQDKELQNWRQQGELRIQQIDFENQKLLKGVDSEARASLEALNNWLSTKRRGELDLEVKKRESQMAAADLERTLGKFRLNIEQQLLELRKKANQYDIKVLDQRIKAEQLIANIRNGAVAWDSANSSPEGGGAGGGTGQFRVGSTGRSTGPHLHIGGTSADKVIDEAMTIIKAWQKMGIEYIKLSNVRADVKNITDNNRLRALLKQEMAIHGQRSGNNPIDIAVPAGTPLPVPTGPVTWGGAASGYRATSLNTGNFFLHALKPEPGSSSSSSAGSGGAQTNIEGYLRRLAYLESRLRVVPNAEGSGAIGYFQTKSKLQQEALQASGGKSSRSRDYTEAASAVEAWIKKHRPKAYEAIKAGRFDEADAILRQGTWPSLPGGSQAQPAAVQAEARKYLPGGGAASAGSGSGRTPVTLNIDTSEIDAQITRLREANQATIELMKAQNNLTSEQNFQQFVDSLDTTSKDLENVNKQFRNSQIELTNITKATQNGIFDPEVLQKDIQYQQGLKALDELRATRLKYIADLSSKGRISEEDRARAVSKINSAYDENKTRLADTVKRSREILDTEREREKLLSVNNARRQAQGNFLQEKFRLESESRMALLAPDDFVAQRYEQAVQAINQRYLELTLNETQPMTEALSAVFEKEREELLKNARSLAEFDKQVNESRRLREMENQVEQNRIERLSSEASARTEAAKAALNPNDFQGMRRLDAQQALYSRYLELTKGDTQPLTEGERKELQRLAEQSLATADALAKVDKELQNFADRLALARDSASIITEGYKGMISSILSGSSITDAVSQMGENVASRFTEKILEYSFKPMEQQLEGMFRKLFGVDDAQTQNTTALNSLTTKIQELIGALSVPNALTPSAAPQLPAGTPTAPGAAAADGTASATDATGKLATGLGKNAKDINTATDQTLSGLQKYTAGLASVATSVLSMVGGIQMMQKGGTYNTLMGLASIFGSLGAFTGMFTRGGVFGPPLMARASGGPVISRQPYLVGEQGPELFIPESDGQVLSSNRTTSLFQRTRSALPPQVSTGSTTSAPSSEARLSPIEVRYEAQVINSVEYVTAEQHRKGMQEAARRGQMMAYQGMQHSVKVRRRLGL